MPHEDTETEGREPCGDGGRDWGYVATNQGTLRRQKKLEEAKTSPPPKGFGGSVALPSAALQTSASRDETLSCFKASSLWCFVMAALGN